MERIRWKREFQMKQVDVEPVDIDRTVIKDGSRHLEITYDERAGNVLLVVNDTFEGVYRGIEVPHEVLTLVLYNLGALNALIPNNPSIEGDPTRFVDSKK